MQQKDDAIQKSYRRPPGLLYRGFLNPPIVPGRVTADLEIGDTAGLETCATAPGFIARVIRSLIFILCLLVSGYLSAYGADVSSARPFAHPDRIRYDSQCLTIEGKDVFIFSGAFHFFRCPKALWPDRFEKIKEAGFNTVETYVPWNWCEREMPSGTGDFSKVDLKDFNDWLDMAEHFGFYIIVRPGPYICAEWDTGGFPQWLLTKKPQSPLRPQAWLRSDDPVFLAWSKHWFDEVCPVIARHQITRKPVGAPGVILVQVENEYDFSLGFSDEAKINLLKALVTFARADGIDV
ncbi:MAG TPA: beta-galactosidase, partial [Verrucomicrobiae bacterium]|nr:beta-galactosidase [Verrucomicrobiae bacterium]